MNTPPRILFSSLSSKLGLYKEVLRQARSFNNEATVVGADSNIRCSSADKVEEFIVFPLLSELPDRELIKLLKQHNVTHVLPTRDNELNYWSRRKKLLNDQQINVWVSDQRFLQSCIDKYTFAKIFKDCEICPIETHLTIEGKMAGKWVVKERYGSGSKNIGLNLEARNAIKLSRDLKNPVFQPFIKGSEFTAETWMDKNNICRGISMRWRTRVINGESHESEIFTNKNWSNKLKSVFTHIAGGRAHILAQVLVDHKENLYLVEINPRLGGASTLSLNGGIESIKWSLLEDYGKDELIPTDPKIHQGMRLFKTNDIQIIKP